VAAASRARSRGRSSGRHSGLSIGGSIGARAGAAPVWISGRWRVKEQDDGELEVWGDGELEEEQRMRCRWTSRRRQTSRLEPWPPPIPPALILPHRSWISLSPPRPAAAAHLLFLLFLLLARKTTASSGSRASFFPVSPHLLGI
jgi:hypothetical protein